MPPKDETVAELRARVARHVETLRAMVQEYAAPPDARKLTTADRRLVKSTPFEGLMAAANFIDVMPGVAGALADRDVLLQAIEKWPIHVDLLLQAKMLVSMIEDTMVRDRLEASHCARGIYRVGKSYFTSPQTSSRHYFLFSMKEHLGRKTRRKPAEEQPEPGEEPAE